MEYIVKYGQIPLIPVSLPDSDVNQSFEWLVEEENGKYHLGEFHASHVDIQDGKLDLALPIKLETGYHNFRIRSESGKESFIRIIVIPPEPYKPLVVDKGQEVKGLKLNMFDRNPHSEYVISSFKDLRNAIIYAAEQDMDVVYTDPLYQEDKITYNTTLIDVDEAINFVEDKEIRLKILTEEFQDEFKAIQEAEETGLQAIHDLKIKIYRLIYNSFREHHINNNTHKAQDFFNYIATKGDALRKPALSQAIKEYQVSEDPESIRVFEKSNIEAVQFYEFLQWLADMQLSIAGRTAWIHNLGIGICMEMELEPEDYDNIIEILAFNMFHTGAIKFKGEIPEDMLGIVALESHKNKCAIIENGTEIPEIADFDAISLAKEKNHEEPGHQSRIEFNRTPLSVYRLQFHKNFTFKDAQNIVPYLKDLGISHCYASPLLQAAAGSIHGYDIIDHSKLNREIGTPQDFYDFVNTLHYHGMGLIVDIVPNHMGIGTENQWWMDVLENGQDSQYASYFDIDWEPLKKELKGKVLVPVLGDHYGNVLNSGHFKFHFNQDLGKLSLNYWEHEFPINPASYHIFLSHRVEVLESRLGSNNPDFIEYLSIIDVFRDASDVKNTASKWLSRLCHRNQIISGFIQENLVDFEAKPNDTASCDRVHEFLEEQYYRLAYWRVSRDVINYRRFFDVNHLIGLKTEDPLVFTSTHSLILDLIEQGKIDGLRIDHPDGLLDPTAYFKTLQTEAGKRLGISFDNSEEDLLGSKNLPIYVVAEKILAPFEKIPKDWAITGTVGYGFLNDLCNLLIDGKNSKKFTRIYNNFIEKVPDFSDITVKCKKLIMRTSLTSELSTLSNHLNRISERNYSTRDYTLNGLRDALTEIIANFPVYRTYISPENTSEKATHYIKWAIGLAKKHSLSTDPSIFEFIEEVILTEPEFAMKFQQYTAPLMAKGVEDTSFYRYNRLIALNEVGGEPMHFGISLKEFHNRNIQRQDRMPHSMLCTSTHDAKRSEDVRARICVLSEIPDRWQERVNRWSNINQSKKTELDKELSPDKNDEYLFYQTLMGIWGTAPEDELTQRIEDYMIKAIREAKSHTSWININTEYEDAIKNYIRKVLTLPENHPFWKEFLSLQGKIAHVGHLNSLTQCVLKLMCPGVPDIYQGCELFNFSLVDPDNRRLIDFNEMRQKHEEVKVGDLFPLESGKMKMFLISKILNFSQKHQNIFRKGKYVPLKTRGVRSRNLVAFAREYNNEVTIVIVPRLMYNMVNENKPLPIGEETWKDTALCIPKEYFGHRWRDIFTGQEIDFTENYINIGKIMNTYPFAVLHGKI